MQKQTVVYTYGAFDLLHPGHIKLLEKAKALGDYLIVGIVADSAIKKLKGPDRPIQNQGDRARIVASLRCVDEVVLQEGYDPSFYIETFPRKINILTKGDDWDYIPGQEKIRELGGKLVKLSYSKEYSTSQLVKRIRRTDASHFK